MFIASNKTSNATNCLGLGLAISLLTRSYLRSIPLSQKLNTLRSRNAPTRVIAINGDDRSFVISPPSDVIQALIAANLVWLIKRRLGLRRTGRIRLLSCRVLFLWSPPRTWSSGMEAQRIRFGALRAVGRGLRRAQSSRSARAVARDDPKRRAVSSSHGSDGASPYRRSTQADPIGPISPISPMGRRRFFTGSRGRAPTEIAG